MIKIIDQYLFESAVIKTSSTNFALGGVALIYDDSRGSGLCGYHLIVVML